MLAALRRVANTLPFKVFFTLLMASFALWGIGDVVRNLGRDTSAASVAGQKIEMPELQEAYRRNLAQAQRALGMNEATPDLRRTIAVQTVGQSLTDAALTAQARKMGLAVPDDALRQAVEAMPAFRNAKGEYDPNVARAVLRNNGLSDQRFAELLRTQLLQQQMLGAVAAGVAAPEVMANAVYAFEHEKRTADAVVFPFAAGAEPPAPTEAQLQRWWVNHPAQYSTPEYRRIKAIVLAPETVAKDVQVTDEDLRAAWEQAKRQFNTPEKRSAEVILTQDKAEAERLAAQWSAGADWAAMQQAASAVGAAPVELNDATKDEFPAPELAAAVFATPEGSVAPPVHSELGWHVVKVTKVTPGHAETFEQARDALRKRVQLDKAADLIYDRANHIDNILSAGSSLDDLPGDVGAAAITGTLDAKGLTPDGKPAPIPGPETLRQALITAAFAAKKGNAPVLTQAPNGPDGAPSFYAVTVEDITPPKPRPFEQVAEQVRADWIADQKRHAQDQAATRLMLEVKGGKSLAEAAAAAGLPVQHLPPTTRIAPAEGVPPQLVGPLFSLKQGEGTMVTTPDSYVVAQLTKIERPDPKSDPVGYGQVRDALSQAAAQDMQAIFANAVRDRSNPRVSPSTLENLASPGE
jgi:peptidyl-prolyl cis-trans isomerase D